MEHPFAEHAGAHGREGAVEHAEQGVIFTRARVDEVKVALRGGIDEHGVKRLADTQGAEVGAISAKLVDQVVERRASRADGSGEVGTAETVEGFHGEMVFEEWARLAGEEGVAIVGEGVFECAEGSGLVFGDEQLGGKEASKFVLQQGHVAELGDGELAGGVIDAGEAEHFRLEADSGEVVRALLIEQVGVIDGASGEDASDFAFDEFSWLGVGRLFGDGDAQTCFEESGDVRFCRMPRDAAHGGEVSLGESNVEDGRGGFRVLEEHLVKITEPVEQDDV